MLCKNSCNITRKCPVSRLFLAFLFLSLAASYSHSYFSASEIDLVANIGKYEENLSITRLPDAHLAFNTPVQLGSGKLFLHKAVLKDCNSFPTATLYLQYAENLENGEILQKEFIYGKANEPIDIVTSSGGIFYVKIDTSKIGCGTFGAGYCADGTKAGECSVQKPLFCTNDGELANNSQLCGCPPFAVQNKNSCSLKLCQEGAYAHHLCSADGKIYAKLCENGVWSQSKIIADCASQGKSCAVNENEVPVCSVLFCSDGTKIGDCSKTSKSYLCVAGGELQISPKCGCPGGQMESKDGKRCVPSYCEDGTQNYKCAANKTGFYCLDGVLFFSPQMCANTSKSNYSPLDSIAPVPINRSITPPPFTPAQTSDKDFRELLLVFAFIAITAGFFTRWWSKKKEREAQRK